MTSCAHVQFLGSSYGPWPPLQLWLVGGSLASIALRAAEELLSGHATELSSGVPSLSGAPGGPGTAHSQLRVGLAAGGSDWASGGRPLHSKG